MRQGRRSLLGQSLCLFAAACAASAFGVCCYGPPESPLAGAPPDWNGRAIAWESYAEGLAAGKARSQPIVLIFYTDWCPHCHNYSRLFHDPELVRLARRFVMIRIERDAHRDISELYAPDGEYIPRTFFLTPAGAVMADLQSDNEDFRYFLDEHDPGELIGLMQVALDRLGSPRASGE